MSKKKKFLIKCVNTPEVLKLYGIRIIENYAGTDWKGAEIDNSANLMMLALDRNYEVSAHFSSDIFKAIMRVGTLMVTVNRRITVPTPEVHTKLAVRVLKRLKKCLRIHR